MANNIILGSGIVGMLARHILGWKIIPFYRSRYFSFRPALDDNFIIRDPKLDDIMANLGHKPSYLYKLVYSIGGQLIPHSESITNLWLGKLFGSNAPQHAPIYIKNHITFSVYDVKINELYERLQKQYQTELQTQEPITEIGNHYYIQNGQKTEFDRAISTIPLNTIQKLCNLPANYRSRQVWYYHIQTGSLNFEGANQTLVADPQIDFYKVSNIARDRYLFYCLQELPLPGPYFMAYMPRFEILDGTTIPDTIPIGNKPNLQHLEKLGITSIGANAEHDWCADVGSNIIQILKTPIK